MGNDDIANAYHATIRDLPTDERPRERLARYGASTLQTAELIALIIRVGSERDNAVEMAQKLLQKYGGLAGLLRADFADLCNEHGLGVAKVAQIKAALELGRRLAISQPDERPRITSPADLYNLLGIEMAALAQEQLRVVLLDTKNSVVYIQSVYQGKAFHIPLYKVRKVIKRWSLSYDACTACGTTIVKHHAHGLCRRCARRKQSLHLPAGSWSLNYSKCLACGTNERRHKAKGLCNRCYLQFRKVGPI